MSRIPPFAVSFSPIIFWVSLAGALLCIVKTCRSKKINRWDALFFLSAWQSYNLEFWEYYLGGFTGSSGYYSASTLLILLAITYAKRRGISLGVGLSKADFFCYLRHFAALTILIPIGLGVGFLRLHLVTDAKTILESFISYFLFVAPNEELIFRGIVFNLLARTLNPWPALWITTAIFATIYTHLSGQGTFPNWTYVAFAFVAGLGYGHSYLKTRKIIVPILLHGTVDTIWKLCLRG
jgi:membrane protease YdiL (CAAX protease family)